VPTIEDMTIQRMDHVGIAVEDIEAVIARLRPRGAELVGELGRYRDSQRLDRPFECVATTRPSMAEPRA
jgi:hypothetical protein